MIVSKSEVEAALAPMRRDMEPHKDEAGVDGVTARLYLAVMPALMHWKAAEINRDAEPNETLNALTALVAGQLIAEISSHCGPNFGPEHVQCFNRVLQAVAEEGGAILSGSAAYNKQVLDITVGHA